MTDIAKAEATVSELQRKRAAAVLRASELSDERSRCSYGAHVQHDPESRKRLNEINSELAVHDSELRSIDAAIAEAERRKQQAQATEAAAARAADAEKLAELAQAMCECGRDLDNALFCLVTSGEALSGLVDKIHSLGVGHPNHAQMLSMGERCIGTVLMQTVWSRAFSPIAPGERRTFAETTAAWAQMIEGAAERVAGEQRKENAA
jgi:hypothetical protein